MEFMYIQMGKDMKENGIKIKSVDKEHYTQLMGRNILVNGKMVKKMEKDSTTLKQEIFMMVI